MLGREKEEEEVRPLLEKERGLVVQINSEAYRRLGSRYLWFNKIRTAQKSDFPFLGDKSLEEKMEATRSALQMVGRNLNYGLVTALNGTLDGLKSAGFPQEGLPEKIEMTDRSNPAAVTEDQDAAIISFMPIRFLNLAKVVRDKGKGLDFYAEGLVKKFFFKVICFYCDPANWHRERLGFFLAGLDEEATLADINARLAPLKTELEIFASTYQMFKFGRQARGPAEAGQGNALDETFEISKTELLADLYLQSFIIHGTGAFLFRYFLTLLPATPSPRAYRLISNIFQPALAKVEEVRIRFQASFTMERDKIRLRQDYQAYFKECEAKAMVEQVKVKGVERRKINYTHRLLDVAAFSRSPEMGEKAAQQWKNYLKNHITPYADSNLGMARLMEILNLAMRATNFSVAGKLEVVTALRTFAVEQEKLAMRQLSQRKKTLEEAKRNKLRTASKFRSSKQFDMVKTIEQEAAAMEIQGQQEIEKFQQAVVRQKETLEARAEAMQEAAVLEGEKNLGHSAAAIYRQLQGIDPENKVHGAFVQFLLQHIQTENDSAYHDFYKHLFTVLPNLAPTEKIVLRGAIKGQIELGETDMVVSPEEMRAYQEQVTALVTEMNMEAPGTMDQRLVHGAINATVAKLLEVGLTADGLRLLAQMPFNLPNKPAAKLPPPVVNHLLKINQLKHPFPEHDIVLPNVLETAPVAKRLNFNRLAKLL